MSQIWSQMIRNVQDIIFFKYPYLTLGLKSVAENLWLILRDVVASVLRFNFWDPDWRSPWNAPKNNTSSVRSSNVVCLSKSANTTMYKQSRTSKSDSLKIVLKWKYRSIRIKMYLRVKSKSACSANYLLLYFMLLDY